MSADFCDEIFDLASETSARMWCSHCHQDVPAISSETRKSVVCARCHRELRFTVASSLVDAGIELDELPVERSKEVSPRDQFADDAARENLRRLGRQLRAPYARDLSIDATPFWERVSLETVEASPQLRSIAKQQARITALSEEHHREGNGYLSFLLAAGVVGFLSGAASLIWSAAFNRTLVWQWGLTATLVSEGLLTVGLTWMALRLWHNSRCVNTQLRNVDDQLEEIHELAGSISAGQLSASQHYYHHFSQVANPHMLMANLRGQIDQLADRIAG